MEKDRFIVEIDQTRNALENKCPKCGQLLLPNAEECWWCKAPIRYVEKRELTPKEKRKKITIQICIILLKTLGAMSAFSMIVGYLVWGASFAQHGIPGLVVMGLFSAVFVFGFGIYLDWKLFRKHNVIVRLLLNFLKITNDEE